MRADPWHSGWRGSVCGRSISHEHHHFAGVLAGFGGLMRPYDFREREALGDAGADDAAGEHVGQRLYILAVSITASEVISAHLLGPVIAALRAEYPDLEIEVVATNDARGLRRREADIALRNFQPEDVELIGKKLGESRAFLYAAPAYLDAHGPIIGPEDVAALELFAFDRTDLMIDGLRARGVPVDRTNFPIVSGSHLVQWELCKRGVGVCIMMEEVGEVEDAVVKVLPEVAITVPMWLVAHRELRTSRRVRVVFDLLVEHLGAASLHE